MDASSLFGGGRSPPSEKTDTTPPLAAASEPPPRSAASLFGGEADDCQIPGGLQGQAPHIQDLPDDLFGGAGDAGMGGFGGAPASSIPPPGAQPPPPVADLPDGLFGGSSGNGDGASAFGFGGAGQSFGRASRGDRASEARGGPPSAAGFGGGGALSPPLGNDLFGGPRPPPSGGGGGFVEEFTSKGVTEGFGAPPSDLFGGPPTNASNWGTGPSDRQPPRSTFGGSEVFGSSNGPPRGVANNVAAVSSGITEWNGSRTAASEPISAASRSSSPAADCFGAPPPSGSPPLHGNTPPHPALPVDRALGSTSPPPPPVRAFDASPTSASAYGASAPPFTETGTHVSSPPWRAEPTRHSPASSPEAQPARGGTDVQSRTSSFASSSKPSWSSSHRVASPPLPPPAAQAFSSGLGSPPASMFGEAPPTDGRFGAPPPPPTSGGGGVGSAAGEVFGAPDGPDDAWRGDYFGVAGVGGGGSHTADIFGGSPSGEGSFGAGASGQVGVPPPPRGPLGNLEAFEGAVEVSAMSTAATTSVASVDGDWRNEQRDTAGFGAPFDSAREDTFAANGGGDDQAAPWWQADTGGSGQPATREDSSETHGTSPAAASVSSRSATAVNNFAGHPYTSACSKEASDTPAGTAAPDEAGDLGAPPADMFGPPATEHKAAPETERHKRETPLANQPLPPPTMAAPRSPPKAPAIVGGPAASNPFASRQPWGGTVDARGSGREATSIGGFDADSRTERVESPGWEKQPAPPLELGVFGAPPGDLFGATTGNPFDAGEAADDFSKSDGGFDGWGMHSAEHVESSNQDVSGCAEGGDDAGSAPSHVPADLKPPQTLAAPATTPRLRSSFVSNDSSMDAAREAGLPVVSEDMPSSMPVLFGARSSSWSIRKHAIEAKSDYVDLFAQSGKEVTGSSLQENAPREEEEEEPGNGMVTAAAAAAASPAATIPERELPPTLQIPEAGPMARSSFVASGGSMEAAREAGLPVVMETAPSSPPRLFATRSSSWAEREESMEAEADYAVMFLKPGEAPPEGFSQEGPTAPEKEGESEGVCGSGKDTTASSATARPADVVGSKQEPEAGVGPRSYSSSECGQRSEAHGRQEAGGKEDPQSSLSTPFGAWSQGSGTRAGNTEGFPHPEGVASRGPLRRRPSSAGKDGPFTSSTGLLAASRARPVSAPPLASMESVHATPGSASEVNVENVVETPEAGLMAEGKEDERPRWVPPPEKALPAAKGVEHKIDLGGALGDDDDDGWGDDDWGVDDDDESTSKIDGGKANEKGVKAIVTGDDGQGAGGAPQADEPRDEESATSLAGGDGSDGGEGGAGGAGDNVGYDWRGASTEGKKDQTEVDEEAESLESYDSDSNNENEASIAETTASDFFALKTSPDSDPESPRPMSRLCSRTSSFNSVSPLSGFASSSRRGKKGRRRGARDAPRSGGDLGSSPLDLANLPPTFPLASLPRVRRSSAGGLPPPVPAYAPAAPAPEKPARSTWRSLSPSRLEDNKGGRWSISPVLRPRAGSHAEGAPTFVSPLAGAARGGAGAGRNFGRLKAGEGAVPPPPRAPTQEWTRSGASAGVARLGQAMSMPFPRKLGPARTGAGPSVGFTQATAASRERDRASPGGKHDSEDSEVEVAMVSSAQGVLRARGLPQGADCRGKEPVPPRGGNSPPGSDGGCAFGPPRSDAIASQEISVGSFGGASLPAVPAPPSDEPSGSVAVNGAWQTQPPPSGSPAPDQGWMAGLAQTASREVEYQRPPSAEFSSKAEATAEQGNDCVARRDAEGADGIVPGKLVGSVLGSGAARVPPNRPPPLSSDAFGQQQQQQQPVGDIGVTARPSPFVNTSSPLTGGRREASLFGPDVADAAADTPTADGDGDLKTGNGCVSGAADLFAADAPARPADELFTAQGAGVPGAPTVVGERSLRGPGEKSSADVFSQGPPPESPAPPPPLPQSLPNPWGSSPLKQPLQEPRRWPTKAGTGFDRPLTPLAAGKVPVRGDFHRAADSGGEGGDVPAAFCDPSGTESRAGGSDGDNGLGGEGVGGGGGRGAFRAGPASFMPSTGTPGSAAVVAKRPWESGRKAVADGASADARATNRLKGSVAAASRAFAAPAARPSHGPFGGSGGLGGWGSSPGAAAAAATVTSGAPRDSNVRPPGVVATFGFGGRLVCMHPRRKLTLAPAPGVVVPPGDGSVLRKGPVNVWSLKDLATPQAVVRDAEEFPGPASTAPLDKLQEYVERRANGSGGEGEGERLLWGVAGLALQFKGRLTSDVGASDQASPEAAIVRLLKAGHARRQETRTDGSHPHSALRTPHSPATPVLGAWRSNGAAAAPGASRDAALAFPGATSGSGPGPGAGHRTVGSGSSPAGRFTDTHTRGGLHGGGVAAPSAAVAAGGAGVGPFGGAPGGFGGGYGGGGHVQFEGGGEGGVSGAGSREEVEALLVDGKKEEAVDASVRAGLWGLALLIAAQCPTSPTTAAASEGGDLPPITPYQRVVRLYANAFLHSGTPLHMMALAFSGQAGAAIKHGGKSLGGGGGGTGAADGAAGQGGFAESWMVTAAAIVSNKVPGWEEQLVGLGDRLFGSDDVPSAHALFLVAGLQAELPTAKDARLVLPGVDHKKPAHRALQTREATDAVHLLEVLEVASKGNGGQNSALQGHKLRLAMRLADLGYLKSACLYVRSAQAEVAAMGGRSRGSSEQRSPYSPQFITALQEFEDRVCAALGTDAAAAADADPSGGKKERSAGSAAAGAGGWLLNRVTNLVKTSATPGPAPTTMRPSASNPQLNGQGEKVPPGGAPTATGAPAGWPNQHARTGQQPPLPPTVTPFHQHPHSSNAAGAGRGSNISGSSAAAAAAAPPPMAAHFPPAFATAQAPAGGGQGGSPFGQTQGPRPPGVRARRLPVSAGAEGSASVQTSPPAPSSSPPPPVPNPHGPQTLAHGAGGAIDDAPPDIPGGFANTFIGEGPVRDSSGEADTFSGLARPQAPTRDVSPPGAGAATVAKRLLSRGAVNGGSGKGFPHASSAPALRADKRGADAVPPRGGNEGDVPEQRVAGAVDAAKAVAMAGDGGGGGDETPGGKEQAPKSEPNKGAKGKDAGRRASFGGADVAAKPGRLAKMMAKWLYPDAKHADVGGEMEAFYDEKAKRWVFPGENPAEAAAATPSAPPTASQLGGPPGSQGGGNPAAPQSPPGIDANDPLAALMAPPQASIGAPRRHTMGVGPGGGPTMSGGVPFSGGGPPSGGLGWAATGAPPRSGGSGTTAATKSPFPAGGNFTVFAPKAPPGSAPGGAAEGVSSGVSPPTSQS